MSLDYNLTAVPTANWQGDLPGKISEMTYCLIHTLDSVRIRNVTAENAAKIVKRQRNFDDASPPRGWKLKGIENYLFTLDDVLPYVGLTTNVNELSDDSWIKFIRLQRVYSVFREFCDNKVPYNSTDKGIRRFSCKNLPCDEGSRLKKFLLQIGGTFELRRDELNNPVWVYNILNYE